MEITKTMTDDQMALVSIKLSPEDYEPRVEQVLKDHAKKANVPGFRPGKVPMGMIKKQYGTSVLVDEVNRMIGAKLYEYIDGEKLDVLGNPLPALDKQSDINWDKPADMEFFFDMALAPEIKIDINEKRKFDYYVVEATDTDIEKSLENISKRNGEMTDMKEIADADLVKVQWVELNDAGEILEGGILHSSSVAVDTIKDEDAKALFIGKNLDDEFNVAPSKVSENDSDRAAMLGVQKGEMESVSDSFKVKIEKIQRLAPAELNEELFKKLYADGSVADLDQMKDKIREDYKNYFVGESDRKLKNDLVIALLKESDLKLPEPFLKRWLLSVNAEKNVTQEQVDAEYPQYSNSLRWQLIENKVIKESGLTVSEEELREGVGHHVRQQFAQYGINQADDEMMSQMVDNFMKREDEVRKVNEVLYDQKILAFFKEKCELKDKNTDSEKFYEMLSKQQA
ncbi:MAG: trigger factor [Bacteroidia bacterium]|jgi:trigger factor